MKTTIAILTVLVLAGCGGEEAQDQLSKPVIKPARVAVVQPVSQFVHVQNPGIVRAYKRAELTFNIPGTLNELNANEGKEIKAGTIVAKLDDADLREKLEAARVEFERVEKDYERNFSIWKSSEAVSKSAVDQSKALMDVAGTQLDIAEKAVRDSVLRAPFDGTVVKRHVENFQNVQAKEPIISLQDLDDLEVVFNVPANDVINSPGDPRTYKLHGTFEKLPDREFPLSLKAYSAEADPVTNTYQVVSSLSLENMEKNIKILPGMAVTVHSIYRKPGDREVYHVPVSAMFSRNGKEYIWVVGDAGKVASREVTTDGIRGNDAVIMTGLQPGETIVTAGVNHLIEGQAIRPLEQ